MRSWRTRLWVSGSRLGTAFGRQSRRYGSSVQGEGTPQEQATYFHQLSIEGTCGRLSHRLRGPSVLWTLVATTPCGTFDPAVASLTDRISTTYGVTRTIR